MYQRDDLAYGYGAATAVLTLDAALPTTILIRFQRWRDRLGERATDLELVTDLGARIGSVEWLRGLATCAALCTGAWLLAPGFRPIAAAPQPGFTESHWDEARAIGIAPLAYGGDTGRRMGATDAVLPLGETPERPSVDLTATLGRGDGFTRVLERAGVAGVEAKQVAAMVAGAISVDEIKPGTRMNVVLGRRANRNEARPLDHLAFRARLDLKLAVERVDGRLRLQKVPIAVDDTPLRVQGIVGSSLYRSARTAGAPAAAVTDYLHALATKLNVGSDVASTDRFDIIIAHRRAETGEVEMGDLLFAGLTHGTRRTQLLRWAKDGRSQWFEASGVGESRGAMRMPVNGHLTSGFGMRMHPLLGYSRFHKGVDFGAAYGSPIVAATDGVVAFAGWHGGHGNYVKLNHSSGLATGYGHMSRIAVRPGVRVRQGQVIGYVGSTGLSTGPHLHYELYKNGQAINPNSVKFTMAPLLAGRELARFRGELTRLLAVRPGAALSPAPVMASAETLKKKG
ncbi:M23 family metallopeptidase [Flavisphingomonas formosensis]|uniref:M23 family metallopeptidase n=1 Tax=Flavisphingomonas formosensis TaxID=861534 RepID=UPI001E457858|nr:M23 family metallopeptidase [Sphingomonas formosensis]